MKAVNFTIFKICMTLAATNFTSVRSNLSTEQFCVLQERNSYSFSSTSLTYFCVISMMHMEHLSVSGTLKRVGLSRQATCVYSMKQTFFLTEIRWSGTYCFRSVSSCASLNINFLYRVVFIFDTCIPWFEYFQVTPALITLWPWQLTTGDVILHKTCLASLYIYMSSSLYDNFSAVLLSNLNYISLAGERSWVAFCSSCCPFSAFLRWTN